MSNDITNFVSLVALAIPAIALLIVSVSLALSHCTVRRHRPGSSDQQRNLR
jgi:hypothetical protein